MDRSGHLDSFHHGYAYDAKPSQINTADANSLLGNNMGRTRSGGVRLANVYDSGTKVLESTDGPRYPQYGVAEQNHVRWYGSRQSMNIGHPHMVRARSQAITAMLGGKR